MASSSTFVDTNVVSDFHRNDSLSSSPASSNLSSGNLIVINCAINSTLQDLKINPSSGVFTYEDSNDFTSVTSNRYIVWRASDDILELNEYSLNKNLQDNGLRIQFKNSLILNNGVSVHETPDKVYILVTTLVSAHRLIFNHPNKLFSNPSIASISNALGASHKSSQSTDLLGFSIFHQVNLDDLDTPGNYVQLQNTSQSSILAPQAVPFLATTSWINSSLQAFFVVSNSYGSLHITRLPSPLSYSNHSNNPDQTQVKTQTFDLKQNTIIGKFITGFVPSMLKSVSNGAEAAICLLSYSTLDDDLIFALCRDSRIRILSLKRQEILIIHNLFYQSSDSSVIASSSTNQSITTSQSARKAISMKLWWHDDESNQPLPNLIVYVSGGQQQHKSFLCFETILPRYNNHSTMNDSHNSLSFSANSSKMNVESRLRQLNEIFSPNELDLLDYFVSDGQLWALWQHNDVINLQYYSISGDTGVAQSLEWMPVVSDLNAAPEMGLRSALVNSREYYLNEIFWRGNFSLTTIAKAINVLNRVPESNLFDAKIDILLQEAIKLVDNVIRNQVENQLEFSVEEYTKMELDAWNQLYLFCLEYHSNENRPLSIFVDPKTGVKGIVRKGNMEIVPSLNPFDDLINHYFLLCKEVLNNNLPSENEHPLYSNGGPESNYIFNSINNNNNQNGNLFSMSALEYRLNTLMTPIDASINGVFSSTLENSILALLHGMAAVNSTLQEEDLLNFEAFMHRLSSYSSKAKLSLADIAKKITEDSLFPEMKPLSDSNLGPLIDDFFEKCPLVAEAINFLLQHVSFDFHSNPNEILEHFGSNFNQLTQSNSNNAHLNTPEDIQPKMQDALQYEILPIFNNLLSSQSGLQFVVTSIGRMANMRYKFCRDLFLFQFMLSKFRFNLKSEYMPKIMPIEAAMIPQTAQMLFALNYLSWATETPMVTPNIWWKLNNCVDNGFTTIVNVNSSPSSAAAGATIKSSSIENSELLSVLELREYINLNRVGILSYESTFYDAYPHSNILHFFIQFSGGILAKRLISYKLALECRSVDPMVVANHANSTGIWFSLMSNYLTSICQLLWPFSAGQFKLAEFLLGVAHYDLLESYVYRLHSWCLTYSYSRFFLKGVCYLVTGEGHKAIRQFKQAIQGINSDPFLFRIFAQKAKSDRIPHHDGSSANTTENNHGASFPNSRTIFRYYNKLIQLFKRYSSPDHIIELVEVALNTLDKNVDPEYEEHYSALHSTLFACHLRLGNVSQAYEAMINNSDLDQRKICLRQFILNLCESGQLGELVSFSYPGLEDDFVSILESKARASSFSQQQQQQKKHFASLNKSKSSSRESSTYKNSRINYYEILYAYFVRANNYRRAAQTMFDYFRRLSQETSPTVADSTLVSLQKQCGALLIARNCLKLVDPTYSWIIKNTFKQSSSNNNNGSDPSSNQLKRKHGYFNLDSNKVRNSIEYNNNNNERTIIDIIDDDELLAEYELVNARLRLLQRNAKEYTIASTPLTPDETVILCISACLYEQAFRLCSIFKLPLEPIFEGMTSKYVQLLNGAYNRQRLDDDMLVSIMVGGDGGNSPKNGGGDGENFPLDLVDIFYENGSNTSKGAFISYSTLSICDRMWHLIWHYLTRFEKEPKKSSRLMRQVAEKLLSNGIMIPTSLLKFYQRANCPEIIRLLITYDFLPAATNLCIDYMNAIIGYGTEYFDISHNLYSDCPPLYIPLHIFDCLANILQQESEQIKLEAENSGSFDGKLSSAGATDLDNCFSETDAGTQANLLEEDQVDFFELYKNLSKTRQKLQEKIVSCSN